MKKVLSMFLILFSLSMTTVFATESLPGELTDYCHGFVKAQSGYSKNQNTMSLAFYTKSIPAIHGYKIAQELGFKPITSEDDMGVVIWVQNQIAENVGKNPDNKLMTCIASYGDLFLKYGQMYGVDPNLLALIAAQEGMCETITHEESEKWYASASIGYQTGGSDSPTTEQPSVTASSLGVIVPTNHVDLNGSKTNQVTGASSFRNYNTTIDRWKSNNNGINSLKDVDGFQARPGYTDHYTGLVVDVKWNGVSTAVAANGKQCGQTMSIPEGGDSTCFNDPVINKTHELAAEYGWIIRYPMGKTNITGYRPEYWHFRYVGKDLSKQLYNNGSWTTLEEHFGIEGGDYVNQNKDWVSDGYEPGTDGGTYISDEEMHSAGNYVILNKKRYAGIDYVPNNLVQCDNDGPSAVLTAEACEAFKEFQNAVKNYKEGDE